MFFLIVSGAREMPSRLNLSRQLRSTRGIAMKGRAELAPSGGINRIRLSECEDKSKLVAFTRI